MIVCTPMMKTTVLTACMLALLPPHCSRGADEDRPDLVPTAHHVRAAKLLALNLPLRHLNREPLSQKIATNALAIYLDILDFERVYFLQSDIDAFVARGPDLAELLRAGDLSFAFHIYNVLKTRVANRVAYVHELLDRGFDFSEDETYAWKRRHARWPSNEEEWNDLWRKKIKNEYVAHTVARAFGGESLDLTGEDSVTNASLVAQLRMTSEERIRKNYDRFLTILRDNDATWVTERYLTSFARAYDPHSDYLSPWGVEDFEIGMKLSLQGIGALLSSEDGAAKVERLIPGGPAERDGRLKPGDKIIAVAQGDEPPVDILHWPLSRAVRLIRGEKGSKVVLTVIPASDSTGSEITVIDLIRDEVKLEDQAAKRDLRTVIGEDGVERKIGIITLPEFYADLKGLGAGQNARSSAKDVARLIRDLREEGAEALVLDLRNNGGGSLSDAIQLTGMFIDRGPVVQVRDQRRVHTLNDPEPGVLFHGPVAVLVNRMSASASEILAGALQDYARAIIIGDSKTHGKGTVQTLIPLSNVSTNVGQIKVTTASFYRIAGGSTQLRGVEPDIVIPSPLETMEIGEEYLPHALPWSQVAEAAFAPVGDLPAYYSELKLRSRARLERSEKYSAYTNLLAQIAARQRAPEITLRLDARMALAESERAMRKALEGKVGEGDSAKRRDFALEESMQVLCDWLALRESARTIGGL
jgi:carboxyl-terminal processing protease